MNLLKNKDKTLEVKKSKFSPGAIENSKKVGAIMGSSSKYSVVAVEVASVGSGLLGLDSSGMFISFSQTLKMIARFRFIKVNFGKLLGTFLEKTGDALEPKATMEKSSILDNQTGTRGKLSNYEKSLTTFDLFHYKIVIYMVSFLVRILSKYLVIKMKKNGKINKKLFYFVYFHNRIHFIIFNLYLSGCVFLNARSILHMKYLPDTIFMIFDKYLNILCFFFYWCDIMELLYTSLITDKTAAGKERDLTESKGYALIQEAKEVYSEKLKKAGIKTEEHDNSVFQGINTTKSSVSPITDTKLPKELLDKLPDKIPGTWISPKEAEVFNYKKVENFE